MSAPGKSRRIYTTLYFRVFVGIVLGCLVGRFFPRFGGECKPVADGFLKLIRMLIAPIVFFTVVTGIAKVGDLRRIGRIGLKSILYFESVTTLALLLGMGAAALLQPGRGVNFAAAPDAHAIAQYTTGVQHLSTTDFLLNIIPDTFLGAFSRGEMLQVLLLAVLSGIALAMMRETGGLLQLGETLTSFFFQLVAIVMETAPLGAFGAMAFTVGRYGTGSLLALSKLFFGCCATSLLFVLVVLGSICWRNGINLWRFLVYIREELLIVLGTSSSEPALPRLMLKLEALGCPKAITGLVVPAGYSFNLDGTSIYLSMALMFVAQSTNTHLSLRQETFILLLLMLNSKGAATVTGGGLITLAATLTALGTVPVSGIALLIGIDRFLSQLRSLVNIIGNGVATIAISRWEGQLDSRRAASILARGHSAEEDEMMLREHAGAI